MWTNGIRAMGTLQGHAAAGLLQVLVVKTSSVLQALMRMAAIPVLTTTTPEGAPSTPNLLAPAMQHTPTKRPGGLQILLLVPQPQTAWMACTSRYPMSLLGNRDHSTHHRHQPGMVLLAPALQPHQSSCTPSHRPKPVSCFTGVDPQGECACLGPQQHSAKTCQQAHACVAPTAYMRR
jgi:hypothetical protein